MNALSQDAPRRYRWPVTIAATALAATVFLALAAPPRVAPGASAQPDGKPHMFVPTEVQLPAEDDPPAPTF